MFPTLRFSVTGADPKASYLVLMDIIPVDDKRYRYAYHRSTWLVSGKADPPAPTRLCMHPDAPFTGEQLIKQPLSFEKVKLTNNEMDEQGHVRLLTHFFSRLSSETPSMKGLMLRMSSSPASCKQKKAEKIDTNENAYKHSRSQINISYENLEKRTNHFK